MKYYITKDKQNGEHEVIKEVNGDFEKACEEFDKAIREHSHEYHIAKSITEWRILRLFDSDWNQLGQES